MQEPVADKWATDAFSFKERHTDLSFYAATNPYFQYIASNLTPNFDQIVEFLV